MADPSPLETTIATSAAGPRKASGDEGSVEEHSLKDQIEADKYLSSKAAARAGGPGITFLKINSGGARGT